MVPERRARELALQDLRDASQWGAADPEVVAATATRIALDDPDAWLREWTGAGGEAWARAGRRGEGGQYLHAASYYAAALAAIADTDGSVDESQLWSRQRECWDRAVSHLGGEPLSVPYEDTALPGYFFSGGRGRRPLVMVDPGGRAATSQAWACAGAAAHALGYHWMTFDGPGRQAALRRQDLVLRLDWEAVLAPLVDAMVGRCDVDASRVAMVACELAGFNLTRGLAHEHRLIAAAVRPGIVDASLPWIDALPAAAQAALLVDDRSAFDAELHLADLFEPQTIGRLRRAAACFDASHPPLYELYKRIRGFQLGAETDLISTRILITDDPEDDRWPGQSAVLHKRLADRSLLRNRAGSDDAAAIVQWVDGVIETAGF